MRLRLIGLSIDKAFPLTGTLMRGPF
jgi:hypothetical protein